ncbi:MAG: hypothetical protein FD174_645 [Geobacteraceae bacterium]|nr:MAG: hypothetical protein FD174_645 [Geobacteraceae bacterium]
MKVPFRQQVSEYDCGPTSLINALSYLFDRREIPPFVVHRVYKDCLDIESSRGTSSRAIQDLGFWLSHYKEKRYKKFAVESKFISGDQVHLQKNSKILQCINSDGAALMIVHSSRNNWHYIIGLRSEGGWLHCYDPSPRSKRFINSDAVQFVDTTGQQDPNLIIRCDWLDKNFKKTKDSDERKYVFGSVNDRECLLLNRIRV